MAVKSSKKIKDEDASIANADNLPTEEEARAKAQKEFALASDAGMHLVRERLAVLNAAPPQVLLFEGADADTRLSIAKYWAASVNCEFHTFQKFPCLTCLSCLETAIEMNTDFVLYNGMQGSIKIDEMRALKIMLATAPYRAKKRVVLFYEAQSFTHEAANSLLKVLEEPSNHTLFILTAPQRERLLPTLVSRSVTVILPSVYTANFSEESKFWHDALYIFFTTGKGWFDITSTKGLVDSTQAQVMLMLVTRALSLSLATTENETLPLAIYFSKKMSREDYLSSYALIERCQEALQDTVNPALVLDYFVTQFVSFCMR